MEAMIVKLLQFGTTPAIVVLAALVGILIKKIEENGKKDEERAAKLSTTVAEQVAKLEHRFEDRFAATDKRYDELSTRVSYVEKEYLPREEHYREFSGWRAEIQRVVDLIVGLYRDQSKKESK